MVGVSLTELTVNTNVSVRVFKPSETVMPTVDVPYLLATGRKTTVRFEPLPPKLMRLVGSKVLLLDVRDKLNKTLLVSISLTLKLTVLVTSSLVLWFDMSVMVGVSLTELTVNTKVSVRVFEPSDTVIPTVALPYLLATGLNVTVLLEPLPPKLMRLVGSKVLLLDVRDKVNAPLLVSISLTEKLTVLVV